MSVDLRADLTRVGEEAKAEIDKAGDLKDIEAVRVKYLGRKGQLSGLLRGLGALSPEERPAVGALANKISEEVSGLLDRRVESLSEAATMAKIASDVVDVGLPGRCPNLGHVHPITQITDRIVEVFVRMGFDVATGPEVEKDYYNFEALNFPTNHPARDMQDTFYIKRASGLNGAVSDPEDIVLRTHTSSVQIRYMEKHSPPIRIVCPGRVYRSETPDATHIPMFHQVEGFLVDEGVTFADLKGALETFVHEIFSPDLSLRFRPSFFPFTEPSAEVDIQCVTCGGSGCRICKGTGYLEILGAGMIDPNVLLAVNIDPEKYTGWAFGIGCERVAMLKWGFTDLRVFYENDVRMLRQF